MHRNVKWHEADEQVEKWRGSSGTECEIVSVRKFGNGRWDYEVTYRCTDGTEYNKDIWNLRGR